MLHSRLFPEIGTSMSIQHITLFELVTADGSADVDTTFEEVGDILATIPGVLSVSCGRNLTDRVMNVDFSVSHASIVTFESKQALQAYMTHPDHLRAQKLITPHIKKGLAVDIENESGDV